MTNLGFLATSREKKYSDRYNHPRNACKYVKREWDEFESRWYFVNVCNESSKKEFQSEPGWREFAPHAMILAEVMSTTLVLMILKCYYDENHIFSIEAILRHKQVACMRRKILFTIFKYLFLFQRY